MAGEFGNLGDALKKIITPKILEDHILKESAVRRYIRQNSNAFGTVIPPGGSIIPMPKTGEQIVSVDTPDGPRVFDFVDSVNYLDSGGLEVNVLHNGNRTSEVFPDGKWDHCTIKTIAIEDEKSSEEKASLIEQVMGKPAILKANLSDELLVEYFEGKP